VKNASEIPKPAAIETPLANMRNAQLLERAFANMGKRMFTEFIAALDTVNPSAAEIATRYRDGTLITSTEMQSLFVATQSTPAVKKLLEAANPSNEDFILRYGEMPTSMGSHPPQLPPGIGSNKNRRKDAERELRDSANTLWPIASGSLTEHGKRIGKNHVNKL